MTEVKLNCLTPNIWEYLFIEDGELIARATMSYVRCKKVHDVIKLDVDLSVEEDGETFTDRFRFTATQEELDYYKKDMAIMPWLFFAILKHNLPSLYHGLVQFRFYPIVPIGELTNLFNGDFGLKLKKFIDTFQDIDDYFYVNSRPLT